MSDELKVQLTSDTKSFDASVDASFSRAENIIRTKIEKPLDRAFDKTKKNIKEKVERSIQEAGDKAEKSFGQQFSEAFTGSMALPNIASAAYLAEKAVGALAVAGDKLFNVFQGEKLLKIEKQFEAMASSFNVSADIAKAFESRGGGLFEDDQMMQALTEKLITFEGRIEKMPELFTTARKAVNLFGGDAMDMFEKLAFAAQTGNTRSLRFIFPKLELDKEIEKYAQSQNKLVSELTQTEIQQVRLNTILEEADKRLKNVAVESGSAENGFKRFKVAVGDLADEMTKTTAKAAGGFFSTFFNGMADMIKGGPKAVSEIKSVSEAMENQAMVTRELAFLEKDLENYRKTIQFKARGDDQYTVAKIKSLKELNAEYQKYIERQKAIASTQGEMNGPNMPSKGYTSALSEINKQLRDKIEQSRMILLNNQFSTQKDLENLNLISAAKEKQNQSQLATEKLAILKDYQSKALITEQQFEMYRSQLLKNGATENSTINASLELAQQNFNQRRLENTRWYEEQKREIERQANEDRMASEIIYGDSLLAQTEAIGGLMLSQMGSLRSKSKKTMADIAKTAYGGLVGGIGGAIKNMTLAFRDGKNGLQGFGEAMLATFGDVMAQMGQGYIAMAIPMFWSPLPEDKAAAPGLLAGGIGLVAAGTLLSASVGNGSTQGLGGTTGNAGGGVTGGTVDTGTEKAYRPDDLAEVKQQPKIEVNFAGNLLNNKESALYIAEVLQEASFSNDIKFAGV